MFYFEILMIKINYQQVSRRTIKVAFNSSTKRVATKRLVRVLETKASSRIMIDDENSTNADENNLTEEKEIDE